MYMTLCYTCVLYSNSYFMCFNFRGVLFCGFSIFADFVFLNLQMLAIVSCISIDAKIFVHETFTDSC